MRQIGVGFGAGGGNLTHDERAKLMHETGFTATFTGPFGTDAEQVAFAEIFAKNGITYENLHAPFSGLNKIWKEDGDEMLQQLLTCVDRCAVAAVPMMVVHLTEANAHPPELSDLGMARFERLVEYAAKKNVTVAFENIRKLSYLAWAFEHFREADNVGFCLDIGHQHCFTPGYEFLPFFGKQLVCTHIHDNMGTERGFESSWKDDLHLLPFEGTVDFHRFAQQIRDCGYNGSLMLEIGCNPMAPVTLPVEEYLAKAAESARRLRKLIDG